MKRLIQTTLLIVLSLGVNITMASSPGFHPLKDIEKSAQQFIQGQIPPQKNVDLKIKVDSLDSRLKLANCETPLEAYLPQNSRINARVTVGIRCNSNKPWQLYVPVSIAKITEIYVASNALMKGDIVSAEDLRLVQTDINKLRTRPITNPESIIGMVVKRNISTGSPFSKRYIKLPTIVKRGDAVNIIASTTGLNIRMVGKAMGSGALGQRIRVKNTSSKRMVEAIVVDANTVKVRL